MIKSHASDSLEELLSIKFPKVPTHIPEIASSQRSLPETKVSGNYNDVHTFNTYVNEVTSYNPPNTNFISNNFPSEVNPSAPLGEEYYTVENISKESLVGFHKLYPSMEVGGSIYHEDIENFLDCLQQLCPKESLVTSVESLGTVVSSEKENSLIKTGTSIKELSSILDVLREIALFNVLLPRNELKINIQTSTKDTVRDKDDEEKEHSTSGKLAAGGLFLGLAIFGAWNLAKDNKDIKFWNKFYERTILCKNKLDSIRQNPNSRELLADIRFIKISAMVDDCIIHLQKLESHNKWQFTCKATAVASAAAALSSYAIGATAFSFCWPVALVVGGGSIAKYTWDYVMESNENITDIEKLAPAANMLMKETL